MSGVVYARCLAGITRRELLRFLRQRGRFFSSLVRPLVWLVVFAAGFRAVLGMSRIPPYETYILYEEYIVPGLLGMVLLFAGMQGALAMVYDREMGSMKILLTSPLPRWFLLAARLFAVVLVAAPQAYAFLAVAWFWDVRPPTLGYLAALPAIVLGGLMLGAIGLLLSSIIEELENFAGVMNFVIFPMFFASTALYPLWRLEEASVWLARVAAWNPFSHAVELIRFALYGQLNARAAVLVTAELAIFLGVALYRYDPSRGMRPARAGLET